MAHLIKVWPDLQDTVKRSILNVITSTEGVMPAAEIVKSIDKAAVDRVVKLDDVKQDRESEKMVREIQTA